MSRRKPRATKRQPAAPDGNEADDDRPSSPSSLASDTPGRSSTDDGSLKTITSSVSKFFNTVREFPGQVKMDRVQLLSNARKMRRELSAWLREERAKLSRPELRQLGSALGRRRSLSGLQRQWRRVVTGDAETRIRDHVGASGERIRANVVRGSEQFLTKSGIREKIKEEPVMRLIDRLSFTAGLSMLVMAEAMLVARPRHFWMFFVVVIPTLLAMRGVYYCYLRWHFFTLDFCYFVQATCLASCIFFPENEDLWRLNFVWCNGPLAMAVIIWKNSLVFHSFDKITSLFIHLIPPMLTWCVRWQGSLAPVADFRIPGPGVGPESSAILSSPTKAVNIMCSGGDVGIGGEGGEGGECSMYLTEILWYPLFGYMVWQTGYYLLTWMFAADPTMITSVRWLARDSKNIMNKLTIVSMRACGIMGKDENFDAESIKTKVIFTFVQGFYTLVCFVPAKFMFNSFWVHTAWLLLVFGASVWNGARYYIDVFTVRYIKKFAPILQSLPSDGEEGEDGEDGEDDDETNDEAAGDNGLTEDMMSDYQ